MQPIILSLLALQLQVAALTLDNMRIPTADAAILTAQDYENYASTTISSYGLPTTPFVETLRCESQFNPTAVGDHGTSLGIAQIHLPAHPDVSRITSLDGIWSINWAAQQFADGNARIWSCYRKLYGDAPYGVYDTTSVFVKA